MDEIATGAGHFNLEIKIGSVFDFTIQFTEEDETTAVSVAGATWELFLKRNRGDRVKSLVLSTGNGISLVSYTTNTLYCVMTALKTTLEEGEYYWELNRTDLNKPYLSGLANLTYDAK